MEEEGVTVKAWRSDHRSLSRHQHSVDGIHRGGVFYGALKSGSSPACRYGIFPSPIPVSPAITVETMQRSADMFLFATLTTSLIAVLPAVKAHTFANAIDSGTYSFSSPRNIPNTLSTRADDDDFPYNETSICYSYGIDFQHGGNYFINSQSSDSFTCVSQFDQCVRNTNATVVLVNDASGDQLQCTSVPTTPDLQSQMSTCPILKSQLATGDWSILILGNNGDGSPFAWERDFYVSVGIPQTTTTTATVTLTHTTTPVTTATSKNRHHLSLCCSCDMELTSRSDIHYQGDQVCAQHRNCDHLWIHQNGTSSRQACERTKDEANRCR